MDNREHEKENERRNSNTEYQLTKCRVTKPPPPKPATNPLQFVKVSPCPLFQKAREQIQKVEEIKKERKEIRDETEDWQQNLDNWKSSRRKRQEHIIERVVEVKKLTEQEELEKARRKSKTFSEMMEERSKGRHKFTIPIYDDDSNDFSDYGIGSSSSKTNSIKDADTDDSSSILDEKDQNFESQINKDASSTSNQSQSEDENNFVSEKEFSIKNVNNNFVNKNYVPPATSDAKSVIVNKPEILPKPKLYVENKITNSEPVEQYTYEGAIQDYRSRIQSKIKVDESIFTKNQPVTKSKDYSEAQTVLPKGEISKRKGVFETDKPLEMKFYENTTTTKLSEDFANAKSIKDRLKSLEQSSDQSLKNKDKSDDIQISVKERLQTFDKKNNNIECPTPNKTNDNDLEHCVSTSKNTNPEERRCSSPETEIYMNKLNMFNRDLDNLMNGNGNTKSHYVYGDNYQHDNHIQHDVNVQQQPESNEQRDEDAKDTTTAITTCFTKEEIVNFTKEFLDSLIKDATENISASSVQQKTEEKPVIYENVEVKSFVTSPTVSVGGLFMVDANLEPPKVKPPPPPPLDDEHVASSTPQPMKRMNSTKRLKKEIHIKRSSFLGLEEPNCNMFDPDCIIEKPPDLNTFLQKESNIEKSFYKKIQEGNRGGLLKVESQDSGLDIDRGRLSSDTWCSSSTPSHDRQDSEHTSSIASEEDEITKKEREIIEMVEKEEKSRDTVVYRGHGVEMNPTKIETVAFNSPSSPYYSQSTSGFLDEQDSEVLKVEHELRQLEMEEMERQREHLLFRESRAKARLQNNRRSLENICDDDVDPYYANIVDYRKSMPELQHVLPMEHTRTQLSEVPGLYTRKSMPDIQQAYHKCSFEQKQLPLDVHHNAKMVDHRKSMPDLQHVNSVYKPSFPLSKQPIMPGKPLRSLKEQMFSPINSMSQDPSIQPKQHLTRHSLQVLSVAPRSRHVPNDNWIQPKAKPELKNYNQHWVFQEAELRRITEQQSNNATNNRSSWVVKSKNDKPLPDSIIQSITQRVQNKNSNGNNDRLLPVKRFDASPSKEYIQHSYAGHVSQSSAFSSPAEDSSSQDRILSVSGKKKCSYCGNELGRGAAMIIESLRLFYHMDCFKCCVCHSQLGDGLMGTDVRVRNHKLHCHNCYSSDDGVKFSCV